MPGRFLSTDRGRRRDWRLLAGAAAAQIAMRCALRTLDLRRVRSLAAYFRPVARRLLAGAEDRVIWAVEATGRRLPGISSCLVRALVVEMRFATAGRPLTIEVGVRRETEGALHAHAWLHERGRVLTGGPIDRGFVSMLSWDSVA